MLESNKITVYTEQLIPRAGYEAETAICLTYSLDLTMLMAASVSLFLGKEISGTTDTERHDVLAALQSAKTRLRVFCHANQIAVPLTYHKLYSLLEPSVRMITLKDGSFHAKLWLIRYKRLHGEGPENYYKLLVMSRNLTDSRDWDITFSADGETTRSRKLNQSLVNFLLQLKLNDPDKDFVRKLTFGLDTVAFDAPLECSDWEFVGFPRTDLPFPKQAKRIIAISPFLSQSQLHDLRHRTSGTRAYLFSRQEALDELPETATKEWTCFTLREDIIEAEQLVQEDFGPPRPNELHAKCYFWEDKLGTHGFIGSANCTRAAFSENYEAMVLLHFKKNNLDRLLESLVQSGEGRQDNPPLFVPYRRRESVGVDATQNTFDEIRRNVALGDPVGFIRKIDDGYETRLRFNAKIHIPRGYSIHLHPFSASRLTAPLGNGEMSFAPMQIDELTAFFVCTITKDASELTDNFIMRVGIECDEAILQAREAAVYRALFPDMRRLLTYLAWLIDEDTLTEATISVSPNGLSSGPGPDSNSTLSGDIPFYEKILVIAGENPHKLARIHDVIHILKGNNDIPQAEFQTLEEFWKPFERFVKGGSGAA